MKYHDIKDITQMTLEEKANHMLEVLAFIERNTDDEMIAAALIDAGYVIEQQRLAIQRAREEYHGN